MAFVCYLASRTYHFPGVIMNIETAIAANRFGLGARPGELEGMEKDPKAALLDQIQGPSAPPLDLSSLPRSDIVLTEVLRVRKETRELKKSAGDEPPPKNAKKYGRLVRSHYMDQVGARIILGEVLWFTLTKPEPYLSK